MTVAEQMKGVFAVVVAVKKLDEAIASYKKLGFEFLNRTPREAWGLEAAQFKAGGGSIIELLCPVAQDKPVAQAVQKFLDKNGEGMYEVAIEVGDIDEVNRHVKEGGVRIVQEPHSLPSNPAVKAMWISPKSTHGIFLEFIKH